MAPVTQRDASPRTIAPCSSPCITRRGIGEFLNAYPLSPTRGNPAPAGVRLRSDSPSATAVAAIEARAKIRRWPGRQRIPASCAYLGGKSGSGPAVPVLALNPVRSVGSATGLDSGDPR